MHSVQTAWLADRQNQRDFTGGWPAAKFHLYSWALSAHCLAQHSPQLTLVADSAAADLLVGQMQLPHSRVDLALDTFDNPFPKLWVLKKTLAYARQPGPFVHVYSDAYLFDPLPPELAQAPLFAQNLEFDHPYYMEAGQWVSHQFADAHKDNLMNRLGLTGRCGLYWYAGRHQASILASTDQLGTQVAQLIAKNRQIA